MAQNESRKLPTPAMHPEAKPRAKMTKAEKADANTDRALDIVWRVLDMPAGPDNWKLLALQTSTALMTISQQIRLDENRLRLREPAARGGSVEEFYRHYEGGSSEESER